MARTASDRIVIEGMVAPGWEPVRQAFIENFRQRGEVGAACSIYQGGERVVDLWGGVRDRATGAPWEEDTMVLVFSTTKGLSAMAMALAHSRGWLDYEERVATYWPEFAQAGKERTTVRQLLGHQAGLFGFDERVDRAVIADLDRLAGIMERQRPAWEPGERQAYHAISLGFYEGELIRRVDPQHRTLGQLFADEIAAPLGLEFYIRLPESMPDARLAPLIQPSLPRMLAGLPRPILLDAFNPRSVLYRSLISNPGTMVPVDRERIYARELEIPSGGGVGTARAIARAYGVFATDGRGAGVAGRDARGAAGARGPAQARLLRRLLQGRGAVLARLHEAHAHLALRWSGGLRSPGRGRLARVCGSGDGHRLRVRHEPDRHQAGRGSPRRRAAPGHARSEHGATSRRDCRCRRVLSEDLAMTVASAARSWPR